MLEGRNLVVGQGVRFGDDRDEVDLGMQSAHHLDVEWLQRVTSRLYKVYTGVDAVVDNVHAVDLVLGVQVRIEALLNVFHNRSPRVVVVHKVTEARGVNDSQAKTHAIFLDVGADALYADGLGCEVQRRLFAFLWRV